MLKAYYIKSRLCEKHHKAREFSMNGVRSRFCQQCCKVHPLDAFDEDRR